MVNASCEFMMLTNCRKASSRGICWVGMVTHVEDRMVVYDITDLTGEIEESGRHFSSSLLWSVSKPTMHSAWDKSTLQLYLRDSSAQWECAPGNDDVFWKILYGKVEQSVFGTFEVRRKWSQRIASRFQDRASPARCCDMETRTEGDKVLNRVAPEYRIGAGAHWACMRCSSLFHIFNQGTELLLKRDRSQSAGASKADMRYH